MLTHIGKAESVLRLSSESVLRLCSESVLRLISESVLRLFRVRNLSYDYFEFGICPTPDFGICPTIIPSHGEYGNR